MKKLLKEWPQILTIPVILMIWFGSPWVIRKIDHTAGVFDAGTLQIFFFAALGVFVADLLTWILISISWPTLNKYTASFLDDFSSITSFQKILCLLLVFALHFLGFLLLVRAM